MTTGFKAVLIDYDEELFTPPAWVGGELARSGVEWVEGQHRTPELALAVAREADVVLVQSVRPLLTRSVIAQLERCRCIVRLGVGYDSVDVAAATAHQIPVCNVPAYCTDDVADHTIALLMDSLRHLARQDRWIRAGRWDRRAARPTRLLQGSTLGLIGLGRIGRAVARRVRGFELTLLVSDPYLDAETIAQFGGQKVELVELLQRSDFISAHCPLTDETYHLLSHREFEQMKEAVFIVNTSRGPVIDEAALVAALRRGQVAGAGLDVLEQEPLPLDSPLREFEQVTITPHVSACAPESQENLYRTACEIVLDVYNRRWPPGVVNPEVKNK
ncbi:MAG: C-terminal binding protein [Anaerolineae bacterium]|nr:C-terminal binding protein [Anaerolineae bacterium]